MNSDVGGGDDLTHRDYHLGHRDRGTKLHIVPSDAEHVALCGLDVDEFIENINVRGGRSLCALCVKHNTRYDLGVRPGW